MTLIDAGARWRQIASISDNKRNKNLTLTVTRLMCKANFNLAKVKNSVPEINYRINMNLH